MFLYDQNSQFLHFVVNYNKYCTCITICEYLENRHILNIYQTFFIGLPADNPGVVANLDLIPIHAHLTLKSIVIYLVFNVLNVIFNSNSTICKTCLCLFGTC